MESQIAELKGKIAKFQAFEDPDLADSILSLQKKLFTLEGMVASKTAAIASWDDTVAHAHKVVSALAGTSGAPLGRVWARPGVGVRIYFHDGNFLSVNRRDVSWQNLNLQAFWPTQRVALKKVLNSVV